MDYFNAGSGGPGGPSGTSGATGGAPQQQQQQQQPQGGSVPSGGPMDPYAVIPQQFGNGGLPQQQQQQTVYFQFDYPPEAVVAQDYEAYQQQQAQAAQYRAAAAAAVAAAQQQQQQAQQQAQQAQQSPSAIYYQSTGMPGTYFPIHSASEHDFLGPQTVAAGAGAPAPYGAAPAAGGGGHVGAGAGGNAEFMMQHQQRRGNNSVQQQQQGGQQGGQQAGNQQNQQQRHQQQPQPQSSHFMHHQVLQVAQQQQQQAQQVQMQAQRIHGAPINPQQFMVPPPSILQQQQAHQQMHHQMQMHHQFGHQAPVQPSQMQHMQQQQQAPPSQQAQFQQQQHNQGGPNQGQQMQQQQHHQQQNQQNQQRHPNQMHQPHHHHHPNIVHRMAMVRPNKKLRDWPIRCVIEGKYYPMIMGQNGSTIRSIAHACHCRVDFVTLTKRERTVLGGNDRILTVHGHADQASKAIHRILDVIQTEALKDDSNIGADIVLRLRAHNQLCGRLIGKQGCSIKEIMNKTGTNITVAKFTEPPSMMPGHGGVRNEELLCLNERTIIVAGPSIEAVVLAESMISAKLKKCYESDSQLRAAAMVQSMPPLGALPPPMPPGSSAGSSGGVPPPQLIPTPAGLIQVQHFPPSTHLPPTPNNSFLQPGMLQVPPGVATIRYVRMWVPDTMIGALIGMKGKNIKMIIRETGATVKIEAPEEKAAREEAERLKEQQKELDERGDGASSGDHPPVEPFLDDSNTITSADAIEEKPKPSSERIVTVNGDDLQLLKAQSYVFSKMAEISATGPSSPQDFERLYVLRIRTELNVPTRIIGRIIGRGGQNVRELQRITGAVVKIPEDERASGGEVFVHDDGLEEEMTLVRVTGNMHSTHNVQVRLSTLMQEYYRSGEHRQTGSAYGLHQRPPPPPMVAAHHGAPPNRALSSRADSGSPLEMGSLGQVPPISTDSKQNSPKSPKQQQQSSPPKNN